jgi:hypothetical protein
MDAASWSGLGTRYVVPPVNLNRRNEGMHDMGGHRAEADLGVD